MKKYLLFGEARGIGGWQIYCDGRIAFMETCCDQVFFICQPLGKQSIKLKYLNNSTNMKLVHPFHSMTSYCKTDINTVTNKILKFINYTKDDQVVIEATTLNNSLWAEYIAQKTKGTAFCFLLHSHIEKTANQINNFFWFKYNQRLLAGMTFLTLQELFKDKHVLSKAESYAFDANGRPPLTEEELLKDEINEISFYKQKHYKVIGYFGTLSKPHVIPLYQKLICYSEKHSNNHFLFVLIGSSKTGTIERQIRTMSQAKSNYVPMIIPELFPVPRSIFKIMDVCIGSWGCARVAAMTGTKTIRLMDDVGVEAQGIIGITLRGGNYYDEPSNNKNLETFLDELLFSSLYEEMPNNALTEQSDYLENQKKINEFFKPFSPDSSQKEYYDVADIPSQSMSEILIKFARRIIGLRNVEYVFSVVKSFFKILNR